MDRFLDMRDPLSLQLEGWRRDLLDPKHPFDDWLLLMDHGNQLRSLGMLCEEQEDAVTQWRDNTMIDMDDHIAVRYNDLLEHIRRVMRFASGTASGGGVPGATALLRRGPPHQRESCAC